MWRNTLTKQKSPANPLDVDAIDCIYRHTLALMQGMQAIIDLFKNTPRLQSDWFYQRLIELHVLAKETLQDLGGTNTTHNVERIALAVRGNYKVYSLIAYFMQDKKRIEQSIRNKDIFSSISIIYTDLMQHDLLSFLQVKLKYLEQNNNGYVLHYAVLCATELSHRREKIELFMQEFKIAIDEALKYKNDSFVDEIQQEIREKKEGDDLLKILDKAAMISNERAKERYLQKHLKLIIAKLEDKSLAAESKHEPAHDLFDRNHYAILILDSDEEPEARDENTLAEMPEEPDEKTLAEMPEEHSASLKAIPVSKSGSAQRPTQYWAVAAAMATVGLFAASVLYKKEIDISQILRSSFTPKFP
jgi:hypothetical protein